MTVGGKYIIPMGDNNDLPQQVARLLDRFYAGEGIMGKIAGLQWGEGPRLYTDAVDQEQNRFYRQWTVDEAIQRELESWQWQTFLHHCLVDLTHMQGFFVKFIRSRAPRIGQPGQIVRLEHVPYHRCRLVYSPNGQIEPQEIMVGDFPYPDPKYTFTIPSSIRTTPCATVCPWPTTTSTPSARTSCPVHDSWVPSNG